MNIITLGQSERNVLPRSLDRVEVPVAALTPMETLGEPAPQGVGSASAPLVLPLQIVDQDGSEFDNSPSLLGNIQDCLHPESDPENEVGFYLSVRRELLFNLQAIAAELFNSRRLYSCLRIPLNTHGGVELRVSSSGSVYVHGLIRCGLLWVCPCCGSKISELRKLELERGVKSWLDGGHKVAMATYTLRHDASMPLERVLQALQAAQDHFTAGALYSQLKARYGVSGLVRALEVTCGANGWHVHLHELLLLFDEVNYSSMESEMLQRWYSALRGVGFDCNEHGLRVTSGDQAAAMFQARYMSKYSRLPSGQWSIAQELAKAVSKRGHNGSYTPLELLIAAYEGDELAGALYVEYGQAFAGKKHLRFSKGTRALLGLGGEATDDQLANAAGGGELLGIVSAPEWSKKVAGLYDRRIELLHAVIAGDHQAFLSKI
jgi:hypothetical protein